MNRSSTKMFHIVEKVLSIWVAFLMFLIGLTACKDNETNMVNVYVAGETVTKGAKAIATYWKNQEEIPLTHDTTVNSSATCIAVDGNDVYVVGFVDSTIPLAVIWKNGNQVVLAANAKANAITIVNGNVYVAGQAFLDGRSSAVYWKNNEVNLLPDSGSPFAIEDATAIVVVGNDVYVAGTEQISTLSITAKYWKNGDPVSLTDGSGIVYVNGITAVGNDVYVVGIEGQLGKYWKNGAPVTLTHSIGGANAIIAVGNDIYIAGYEQSSNQFINIAKYWKNGIEVQITDGSKDAFARAIALHGSDMYIAGYEAYNNEYWKNNQSYVLASAFKSQYINSVHSICVQ